jgi:hypothetical protein
VAGEGSSLFFLSQFTSRVEAQGMFQRYRQEIDEQVKIEAYYAWERAGRPWLTAAEQDAAYYDARNKFDLSINDASTGDPNWPDAHASIIPTVRAVNFSLNSNTLGSCRGLLPGLLRFPSVRWLSLYVDESYAAGISYAFSGPGDYLWDPVEHDQAANWLNSTWIPSLAKLERLRVIRLSGWAKSQNYWLTDVGLAELGRLTRLRRIEIEYCVSVSPAGLHKLHVALPGCWVVT